MLLRAECQGSNAGYGLRLMLQGFGLEGFGLEGFGFRVSDVVIKCLMFRVSHVVIFSSFACLTFHPSGDCNRRATQVTSHLSRVSRFILRVRLVFRVSYFGRLSTLNVSSFPWCAEVSGFRAWALGSRV